MARSKIPPNANVIEQVIATAGVKPAANPIHAQIRTIIIVLLVAYIIYLAATDDGDCECIELDEVSDVIKPGSLIYQTAMELDTKPRRQYLNVMVPMLRPNPSKVNECFRSVKFALIAGILSEYLVCGNTSKPMGVVARTILYTIVYHLSKI